MQALVRDTKQIWTERFDTFLGWCLRSVSHALDDELSRRSSRRGQGNFRWVTADEAAVVETLAQLIVPSDDESPGIEDVGVLGPSTLESLDWLIANSPWRQELYARGLLAFDTWAYKEHGCTFASLSRADQIRLLKLSEQVHEEWISPALLAQKAWRRLKIAIRGQGIPFSAARLFPQLRNDCLQVFYTSRVSWIWLEYDGPPMDEGYPQLAARRP